jgi:hypothetical protein
MYDAYDQVWSLFDVSIYIYIDTSWPAPLRGALMLKMHLMDIRILLYSTNLVEKKFFLFLYYLNYLVEYLAKKTPALCLIFLDAQYEYHLDT